MTRQTATQTQQQIPTTSLLSRGGILQRQCEACGQHTIAGGECTDCGKKKSSLQRKLTIGASNDPLEREADRIADQVMAAPARLAVNDAPPRIQRFTGQTAGQADMAVPASVDRVLSSPGSPLEPGLQQDMGQRFGHDFSRVRVHTDAAAERSAWDVNAYAYTVGHHIAFGVGRFAPSSHDGHRLIAHELTHVLQQTGWMPIRHDSVKDNLRLNATNRPHIGVQRVVPEGEHSVAVGSEHGASESHLIQRKAAPGPGKDTQGKLLVDKLKTNHGGQEATLPLTPEVLAWLAALRSAKTPPGDADPESAPSPRDPSNFPTKPHEGEAFVWEEGDLRAVDVTDVKQGYLGDCYFMALLAAIAEVRPEVIEQMVQPNADGTSYTVFFFGPKGQMVKQTVEATFPSDKSGRSPTYAQFGDQSDVYGKELWPMLIEKAWMQANGGWMQIEGGQKKKEDYALAMTGNERDEVELPGKLNDEELLARLTKYNATKQPVTFFSHQKTAESKKKSEKSGVITNHGYALWHVKPSAKTADLYNPHGPESEHLLDKSMAFLRANFRSVVFFKLKGDGPKTTAIGPSKEEQVASEAIPQEILKASGFDVIVQEFAKELPTMTTHWGARNVVQRHGERLWNQSKASAQATTDANTDDRPLYWARLQSAKVLHSFVPKAYQMTPAEKQLLIDVLEATSRGRAEIDFSATKEVGERRVLVSGFDPFDFQRGGSRRQSNPSGAAVLALDGQTIPAASGDQKGRIEGVIFPVRFADFDRGIVETTFRPYLSAAPDKTVDMIITISQGGSTLDPKAPAAEQSKAFELERWAGRRRSDAVPDNAGVLAVKEGERKEGKRLGVGPEFLESSLKRREMVGREETPGESERKEEGGKAISGSGGGYLSNEVFYRTTLLRQNEKSSVPVGHLHVPFQPAPDGAPEKEKEHTRLRDQIIGWVKKLIAAALATMGAKK